MSKVLTALGMMSGTSMDGIDAAIVKTDGETIYSLGPTFTTPYTGEIRYLINETSHFIINVDKLTYAGNLESLSSIESNDRYKFYNIDRYKQS